jgi:hypothetical protein
MYQLGYQKTRGGRDISLSSKLVIFMLTSIRDRCLETTELNDSDFEPVDDFLNMYMSSFDDPSLGDSAIAGIIEKYGGVPEHMAATIEVLVSSGNIKNPSCLLLASYFWVTIGDEDSACRAIQSLLEQAKNKKDMGASDDGTYSMLWSIIAMTLGVDPRKE